MSTSITQLSGTLLSASPPRMRPRLIEGRSNRSELSRANGSDSIARNASSAFRIALSPEPRRRAVSRRAADLEPHREHALRLHPHVQVGGLARDREVAAEAVLDQELRCRGRSPPRTPRRGRSPAPPARRARRAAPAARPSSPPARPSCRRRRDRRCGRPRCAARTAPRERARRPGARAARSSALRAAPTRAASSGRPRISSSSTWMSRDSSQPLTNPAALRMPSSFEVS